MLTLRHLQGDSDTLHLEWNDGTRHRIPWRTLRNRCPCATCMSPPPPVATSSLDLLPVISHAETLPLKATGMRPMGNYAYAIQFSDGHNTGIYSLDFLRQLGDELGVSR